MPQFRAHRILCDIAGGSILCALLLFPCKTAHALDPIAEPDPATTTSKSGYSPSMNGPLGLHTIPSARMDPAGTITIGGSHGDPYYNAFLGFQIAEPLYIGLRQTSQSLDFKDVENRLYPGADLKLRLLRESRARPEIAIGMQSAIGHKRTAGEYLAFSKRYKDFDFTFGMGWGRFASAGQLSNPLKKLLPHFDKDRALDGEDPNKPSDWFTGEHIGLFGGVEYFTPVDGLSLKLDYNNDRYAAEKAAVGFNAPAPWSAGLSYQATKELNFSLAMQGSDTLMGRLVYKTSPGAWPYFAGKNKNTAPMLPRRPEKTFPEEMQNEAAEDGLDLADISHNANMASADLELIPYASTPEQIGRAAVHMANHAGPNIETLGIRPTLYGLQGPQVTLLRSDLENALVQKQGSPQEIWQNAVFDPAPVHREKTGTKTTGSRSLWPRFDMRLDNDFSLTEEDRGLLRRTSLILDAKTPQIARFLMGGLGLRLNLDDNLEELAIIRPAAATPIRSDVNSYTHPFAALERGFLSLTHSFSPNFHGAVTGGYLEEMFAGYGGELLYRPFGKRYTLGLEGWQVYKRDPGTDLNAGLGKYNTFTGHFNAWYDIPRWDTTLELKAGRFLAGDSGASVGLFKRFDNGAKLGAFVTLTDKDDPDLLGGTTNAYHGVSLTLPFGFENSRRNWGSAGFNAAPLGRDNGQILKNPMPLYELTDGFSKQHMAQFWNGITE